MSGLVTSVGFDVFLRDLKDKFTYKALQALFNFYTEELKSEGRPFKYSPNDIISKWKEYNSLREAGKAIYPHNIESITEECRMKHTYEFWVDKNTKDIEILNFLLYDYNVIIVKSNKHVLIKEL